MQPCMTSLPQTRAPGCLFLRSCSTSHDCPIRILRVRIFANATGCYKREDTKQAFASAGNHQKAVRLKKEPKEKAEEPTAEGDEPVLSSFRVSEDGSNSTTSQSKRTRVGRQSANPSLINLCFVFEERFISVAHYSLTAWWCRRTMMIFTAAAQEAC